MSEADVVIVDDDDAFRDSLRTLLESYGYNVQDYNSGAEFLKHCDPVAIGCVLLDCHMPGLDGLQVQGRLRRREITLPVILMTSRPDEEIAWYAIRTGVVLLEKLCSERCLLDHIEAALRIHSKMKADASIIAFPLTRC